MLMSFGFSVKVLRIFIYLFIFLKSLLKYSVSISARLSAQSLVQDFKTFLSKIYFVTCVLVTG